MRFNRTTKNILNTALGTPILLLALTASLTACTAATSPDTPTTRDEHNIGEKLDTVSSLVSREGAASNHVAVFDRVVHMIHQFDVTLMAYERTLPVTEPAAQHFLLYNDNSNYVVDLTKKHLTVINSAGVAQADPIKFQGVPRSAAFRASIGTDPAHLEAFLAVYDDLGSVGLLILDANGNVESKTVLGSIVSHDVTITSGDITEDGRLVFALSNDQIAIVDMRASIAQSKWVLATPAFASGLTNITWIAPLRGQPSRVLLKAKYTIALYDLDAKAIVSSYDATFETPVQLSKTIDPHVILSTPNADQLKILYVDGSAIGSRAFSKVNRGNILTSMLDLNLDTWTFVSSKQVIVFDPELDPVDQVSARKVDRYRFSDQLAQQSRDLPDRAQLRLMKDSVFALRDSDLGRAEKYSIDDAAPLSRGGFNRPYLP